MPNTSEQQNTIVAMMKRGVLEGMYSFSSQFVGRKGLPPAKNRPRLFLPMSYRSSSIPQIQVPESGRKWRSQWQNEYLYRWSCKIPLLRQSKRQIQVNTTGPVDQWGFNHLPQMTLQRPFFYQRFSDTRNTCKYLMCKYLWLNLVFFDVSRKRRSHKNLN